MFMSLLSYLAVAGAVVLAAAGFHYLVHRGLAPRRLVGTGTPAVLGLVYREVRIATANGLRLHGWFVPGTGAPPVPAVVLLHGWGGSAETLLPLAPSLSQAGFAVLLFDARCHGRSDEDSFASMPRFAEDLEHALDWLRQQAEVDPRRIAVVGHSVGGAAALLAASRRADVAAVVSIAAFSHPRDMMRRLLASQHIPYWPLGWYILRYVQHVIGHRFDAIAPLTTIRQIRCPTLLVHGADDRTVPVAEAHTIYAARGAAPVQLKIIPGSHDDYGDVAREAPLLAAFLRDSFASRQGDI
ncbi:MAG: dipeptidyl aminopeptidase [Gammaproteobacteria bacterium HGW-Gammaproteobacteria-1]|jgi:pimeloyl-ACP methyl ester carboxylesterase|nr:MAG: dipeptidyl aminopeptidase [Gammaproteobacteria bacterium HGW-Gammaproteobacteria-1]